MNDRYIVYNNAWNVGLCGPDGTVLFSPGEYEDVIVMPEYLSVRRGGKYGAIDMDGNLLVDFKYKKVNKMPCPASWSHMILTGTVIVLVFLSSHTQPHRSWMERLSSKPRKRNRTALFG